MFLFFCIFRINLAFGNSFNRFASELAFCTFCNIKAPKSQEQSSHKLLFLCLSVHTSQNQYHKIQYQRERFEHMQKRPKQTSGTVRFISEGWSKVAARFWVLQVLAARFLLVGRSQAWMACAETQLQKVATFLGLPFMKPNLLFKQHTKRLHGKISLSLSLWKNETQLFIIVSFETSDSEFE